MVIGQFLRTAKEWMGKNHANFNSQCLKYFRINMLGGFEHHQLAEKLRNVS